MIEFKIDHDGIELGKELTHEWVDSCKFVDVSGVSKGKGFAGCVKRHNFATQDATHGNSLSHRAPGSTGQNQTPGRVFKGKKMAGQMGNKKVTVQSLSVIKFDKEKGLLLIKGGIPGAIGADVLVKPAVKKVGE
jgi:large subunit ribosomal protein L3